MRCGCLGTAPKQVLGGYAVRAALSKWAAAASDAGARKRIGSGCARDSTAHRRIVLQLTACWSLLGLQEKRMARHTVCAAGQQERGSCVRPGPRQAPVNPVRATHRLHLPQPGGGALLSVASTHLSLRGCEEAGLKGRWRATGTLSLVTADCEEQRTRAQLGGAPGRRHAVRG